MKQLIFLLILIPFLSYSQDTIFLKNGTKIFPRAGVHRFYGTPLTTIGSEGNKLSYAVENSSWGRSVNYKELDYAIIGDRLIKTFELKYEENGKLKITKPLAHYVLIETEKYRFIYVVYSKDLILPVVKTFIIDKDDTVVESAHFVSGGTKNDQKNMEKVIEMVKKYFSHIKEEMEFLDNSISINNYDGTGLSSFLKTHPYKKYK